MQGEVHDVKYARRYVHCRRKAQFEICKALCA